MRSNSVRSTVAPGRMDLTLRAARLAQPGYFLGDTIATELRGRLGRRRPQVARIVDEALHGGHERVGSAQLEQLAEPLCLVGVITR